MFNWLHKVNDFKWYMSKVFFSFCYRRTPVRWQWSCVFLALSHWNVGEDRGVWTPYPRGSTPPTPAQFFLPTPAPFFFLFLFSGIPVQKSDFLPPPIWPPPPPPPLPFFVKSPLPPSPCPPNEMMSLQRLLYKFAKFTVVYLRSNNPLSEPMST